MNWRDALAVLPAMVVPTASPAPRAHVPGIGFLTSARFGEGRLGPLKAKLPAPITLFVDQGIK
jgi:hypothetical protein